MLLPQEIAAKSAIPALRALVARKLVEKHRVSQNKAAGLLGVTQAAISNYVRYARGVSFNLDSIEEMQKASDQIAEMLASGTDHALVVSKFAEAYNFIQKNRMMCTIHQRMEPGLDVDSCHACDGEVTSKSQ